MSEVRRLQPKSNIVHLPVYKPGKPMSEVKRDLGLDEVIHMASNQNPYGSSPLVKDAILSELENTSIYPDGASVELASALSKHLDVEPNQLIFGAGSDEVVLMLARAFLVQGDETIMATHTFPQYKHNAEIEGAVCVEVPLQSGTHNLDAMLEKVTPITKIVWICNPNNPTGTMNTHDEVKSFMEQVPEHVLVVLDEAYYEYNISDDYPDSLALLKEYKNMVILRTFSKIYGMASLRIGYGIGHPEIIHYINQVREPFNTTRFAQTAAIAALKDQAFIQKCREDNHKGIQYLNEQFTSMGLNYYPSVGNFIMVDVKRPAEEVFDALLRKGIIVRGGHALDFPTSLRVTVGSQEQNEKFITALKKIINK